MSDGRILFTNTELKDYWEKRKLKKEKQGDTGPDGGKLFLSPS